MKKLIILRGNSASGKTTIAKELQKSFGRDTMLISQDVVRREILYTKDGENNLALPLLQRLLEYGFQNTEVVILEGIFNSLWYNPLFKKAKELYGENIFAYYFDLPFEETVKRHETRPIANEFGEEKLRAWWSEKDFLLEISEKPITKEKSKATIIKEIIEDVKM